MRVAKTFGLAIGVSAVVWVVSGRGTAAEPKVGVSVGANSFKRRLVSPRVGWTQFGVYDKKEGQEIVVLDNNRIAFVDPKTYRTKRVIPIPATPAYKQLVSLREDGILNLMAGGGGFSDVGFFELNGNRLWQFKVGRVLPPHKMIAVDLDHDGTKEFYVADFEGVFRLDTQGKVVWKDSSVSSNYYLFTLPAEGQRPAAVVTEQGMWDAQGKLLQRGIKSSVGTYQLQPVKWGETYCLATGETSKDGGHASVIDLTGKTLFRQATGDWSAAEMYAVRFKRGEKPHLIVIGGRGAGVPLMQFSMFSYEGKLVYQEVCKPEGVIVIPDDVAGEDKLLLHTEDGIKIMERH